MQNAYRLGGDQGRFFGRFCQHAVASDQRCGNLADEDRERKIPRTDAHDGAERAGTVAHRPPFLRSIVSQKIDAFAYLCDGVRSEEHTSEHQSLMRNTYAVLCLNTKTKAHH